MKLDLTSKKFKDELKKTEDFAQEVCTTMGFFSNPNEEINNRIYTGLTRNKILHGKRYCPCFIVLGNTEQEKEISDNRVCPCSPAIKEEIPQKGKCNCGIFCSSKYLNNYNQIKKEEDVLLFSKQNLKTIMTKNEITGKELLFLLDSRKNGLLKFILIDVREEEEYISNRIVGVDYLVPTSNLYAKINVMEINKKENIIVQCHSGGRSSQVQSIMRKMGYEKVINLAGGISSYPGETEKD